MLQDAVDGPVVFDAGLPTATVATAATNALVLADVQSQLLDRVPGLLTLDLHVLFQCRGVAYQATAQHVDLCVALLTGGQLEGFPLQDRLVERVQVALRLAGVVSHKGRSQRNRLVNYGLHDLVAEEFGVIVNGKGIC